MADINSRKDNTFSMGAFFIPLLQKHIERIPEGNPLTNSVRKGFNSILDQVKIVARSVEHRSEMDSNLAHEIKVASARFALHVVMVQVERKLSGMIEDFKKETLDERIMQSNLKVDEFAAEIRTVLRSLSHSDRIAFLSKALENGEGNVVAAIVDVPTQLTGMDKTIIDRFKESYLSKWANYDSTYIEDLESGFKAFFNDVKPIAITRLPDEVSKHRPGLAEELEKLAI